jgi:hypothetical protein
MPDEILAAGAAGGRSATDVDDENPTFRVFPVVDFNREKVGTFPNAAGGAGRSEIAQVCPLLEVG